MAQVIVFEKERESARAANDYAHGRAWTTAGVVLGIGVLIGRKQCAGSPAHSDTAGHDVTGRSGLITFGCMARRVLASTHS